MKTRIKYLFTLAVPIAGLAIAVTWMLGLGTGRAALVYDTVEATRGTLRKVVTTSGPVRALVTVSIGSELSGKIRDVGVDFNSEVKAGDLLARIDAKTFESRVAQSKADLAAARASLLNQEASLQKAEAVLKQTERNIERQQTLAARGISAQAALDTAVRDMEVAKAEIAVARAQIENAKAQVAQRQAQLDQAQIDLDRTRIVSPIEGTVISRTVDPGQTVAASLQAPELFKIAQDLRRIRIEAQVNEADVGAVAEGNDVVFTVDAYPERQFEGRVTQVRLAATELNNVVTYTVIIEAANEDRRLFPGMTANVQIEAARREGVLRVPNDALRYRPRGETTARAPARPNGDAGERQIERLTSELQLAPEQETALRDGMTSMFAELRRSGQGGSEGAQADPLAVRQRISTKIEQVLVPTLSAEQRQLYEKWKRGREATRMASVWVLAPEGTTERRTIRIGLNDDQFTEVVGGQLKEGERVIVRARDVTK